MLTFHLPSVQLSAKAPADLPRIIHVESNAIWKDWGFNSAEVKFIREKIKLGEEIIRIQHLDEMVWIVVHPDEKEEFRLLEKCRRQGNALYQALSSAKKSNVMIAGTQVPQLLAFCEGLVLSGYAFLKYKTGDQKQTQLSNIYISGSNIKLADVQSLNKICEATAIARTLVNEPQNFLTATELGKQFQELGKKAGFQVDVLNETKIKSLKMGGLLAVNQGSQLPPTFTIMEYKPARPKNRKPLVLIGKGVVYDTGGLSLKPTPNSMDSMKCDMAGAAVVGAALFAVASLKLPYHVIGLVPATDNRPGENAYTPGDVITMMSGKTVEMLNADAEGRMILADALHYSERYAPGLVIDLATLTGAAAAAIGHFGIVAMGTASEEQKTALKASGQNVYERLVEFPFWDEYKDLLKSDIADMKNIGGPVAGAITAGKFLENYTTHPWMHLDIAGPAFINSADNYRGKNGTGVGVRLLIDFIRSGGW